MQEVRWDNQTPKEKEANSLEDLIPEIRASLNDEGVEYVKVFRGGLQNAPTKIIPSKRKKSIISEERIRQIIREEIKIYMAQNDPLFKKVLQEQVGVARRGK